MHKWGPVAMMGGLSTALALTLVSPPAGAADPAHTVTVSKDESVIEVDGLTAGDAIQVEVRRNGIQIGSAVGVAPPDGIFQLHHKVETAPDTAVCWTGSTPEILGGDVVRVTSGGLEDEVVVSDIDVTQEPTKVDRNTGIVRGRIAGPVPPISELRVATSGRTASDERFDGLAPGTIDGVVGRLKYVAPGRFKATFDGLSPSQMGAFLDSEDVRAIHESASTATASHSTVAKYGADARFVEDLCPPVARRAVTGASLGVINRNNVDEPLRVWGVSADASEVRVGLEDGKGFRRTWPASVVGTGNTQTWSVTYPAGSLARFADGKLTISAEYVEDAGVLVGRERTIRKDTSAPARPSIRPGGGKFRRSVSIRLASPGAREIWYTLGGNRPGRNRGAEYDGAFRLSRTATLKAVAYDAAGNRSRVSSARFTRR
jgi:hypothetical protein